MSLSPAEVLTRGVHQVLPDQASLLKLMEERRIRVYLGIDPTGNLLTLGHAVVLRKLQQFVELGHEVILLIGNGTVRIGDPTGRDSTRPTMTDAQIEENFATWQSQASKILDFSAISLRHNGDWLDKLTFVDLIKLMAQTTTSQLLERDMFQDRLKAGQPIFGHEMLYPLLQGYDSVEMEVDLEIGGTDQTFNMMMGRTLLRSYKQKEKWVLTTPIINGLDGRKMSKSYGNFIALTESATDMYGKLMSLSDEMIGEYFEILTDLPASEIETIKQSLAAGEHPLPFKKQLAREITGWLHTKELAQAAEDHFTSTVQHKQLPAEMKEVEVSVGTSLIEVLSLAFGDHSKSHLRRLIEQGAVELWPEQVRPTDPNQTLDQNVSAIKAGKRDFAKLKWL